MFKKEAVFILASLFFLLGAGCENNPSLTDCEKVFEDTEKIECADNFYFDEAERLNDVSLCESIYDKNLKNKCKGVEGPLPDEVVSPFDNDDVALDSGNIPPKPK